MAATGTPHPKRILIIRPSALGDVCRTVPVLASLRKAFPEARIEWVVQDDFAPAVEAHPALNELITFPRARLAQWWKNPRAARELLGWFAELWKRRYDLVLDCQGLGRSGLMAFLTRAQRRVGLRSAREFGWLGYNVRVPGRRSHPLPVHTVDQMLMLLEGIGVEPLRDMRLHVAEPYRKWWHRQRELMGLHDAPYAVVAPTSRWLSKRWPIDRFAQLIDPLRDRGFAKVLIIGAPSEMNQVRELFRLHPPMPMHEPNGRKDEGFGVIDQVGGTNIGQTLAMIADADLVVANDSAPLHMAVGFERPCVGLFGPTDPAEVGPYRTDHAVVRGYVPRSGEKINFKNPKLGNSLMRYISTTAVLQRIDDVLALHADKRRALLSQRLEPSPAVRPLIGATIEEQPLPAIEERSVIGRIVGSGESLPQAGASTQRDLKKGTGA